GGGGGGGGGGEPPDYGDLLILYRDADGVPYLTEDSCWQPLDNGSVDCPTECLVPGDDGDETTDGEPWVVTVDPATCAVPAQCAICTEEVDFERINESRSPDTVFASQLEDVVVNMATADCLSLDPAGRIVTSRVADDLTVTSSAIDSPLQNLAIYRQLLLTGSIGTELPTNADVYDTMARALGAASSKTGEVNVDLVVYLNEIMGLTDESVTTILGDKICINVREEVMGIVQTVRKCFLDFSSYDYDRDTNFGALPDPAYIPESAPVAGTFEHLYELGTDPPTFGIGVDPIMEIVFDDVEAVSSNITGFAQAADDTRAVIDYMHSWPLPIIYQTPVPCDAIPGEDTTYDVSISDVSGLQVPVQMVDGSEGREFTVNIANAGPDAASGSVTVTAVAENGGVIIGSPWTHDFVDLAAGLSDSWTTLFSINLGERTKINWTATIEAEFDVNPNNDSVTATTNVKVTGGGGGGN
ncbi:MAG: hypothetical protein IH613_18025, partial [Desulfuromonadales bacterium]|nr:hypothetical protein [Desulfuromonadales bacterium]